ncbi:MAG: S41 family peptidase [Armatimonadetes bacterium]|nr:S41 family peptidase [Armatimonadota bacterium]
MERRQRLVASGLLVFVVAAAFLAGYGYGQRGAIAADAQAQGFALLRDLLGYVQSNYVERNVNVPRLFHGAAKGMLEALDDPYTRFLEPRAYQAFREDAKGFFSGVGIFIDLKESHLIVISPIEGAPAHRAGLKTGDWITAINGTTTKDMSLQEAVSRIRGPAGTQVRLTIQRGGQSQVVELTRARIQITSVQGSDLLEDDLKRQLRQERLGYVRILMFNENTPTELDRMLASQVRGGIRGLIVDLRSNGGGLLDSAIKVSDRFVDTGVIVQVVDRSGRRSVEMATRGTGYSGPIVVLVNEFTASASEIMTGALQDHKAATVVGMTTFGKGVIQTIFHLPGDAAAAVTTAKYLTPNGRDINKRGLAPDVTAGEKLEGKSEADLNRIRTQQMLKAIEVLKARVVKRAS